jgi:hypothetical protein
MLNRAELQKSSVPRAPWKLLEAIIKSTRDEAVALREWFDRNKSKLTRLHELTVQERLVETSSTMRSERSGEKSVSRSDPLEGQARMVTDLQRGLWHVDAIILILTQQEAGRCVK